MGATITIYDPVSQNSRSISVEIDTAVIQGDENGAYDYYVRLSTSAKQANGTAVPTQYIRSLADLADTSTQHNGGGGAYADLSLAIEDYILHMVEGDAAGEQMSFTT